MVASLIKFSVRNKLIIMLGTASMLLFGIYSMTQIPIGAVPDITNNQVQVITISRNLSTLDVEQFITYPIELEMANLPGVKEIRSVSKFGLSVVTIVFEDRMGTYLPRQLIAEKIKSAEEKIPAGFGSPEMGPISTGLGEIYQYTLEVKPGYEDRYSIQDLRTIQDWVVKRQLSGVKGIVEVNTWGGYLKQYEVAVDPHRIRSFGITLDEIYRALAMNNENTGGSYIEKSSESYFVRGEGLAHSLDDIGNIVVRNINGVPVLVRDLGKVGYGNAVRFGAITGNGQGEKVMGQIMMLKDANTSKVIAAVKERMAEVGKTLPEGLYINPFLERTELIDKTTGTITENLTLGALIVIFVLVILMGDMRAGLIVASVIPMSLLFGLSMMYIFGIDVNLMSLGAIDFGILVDGAVIIVEFIVLLILQKQAELKLLKGQQLQDKKDEIVIDATTRMMQSAIFGQIIILIVFIPILSLADVEGKMFRPMAWSFIFILFGAMALCLTYVPAVAAYFLKPPRKERVTIADRIMRALERAYEPSIAFALRRRKLVIGVSMALLSISSIVFLGMGGEFIPTLDEGDYVVQPVLKPGTSLSETIKINSRMEQILMDSFPEVEQVVTRIGAAEVPTDPMSMEMSDVIVILKDKKEWKTTSSKEDLANRMKEALSVIPGVGFEFTQPIEMRFNELITGVRADVAVKIYGEDLDVLFKKGNEIKNLIRNVTGAADVNVEQIAGLPQLSVRYDRGKLARFGLNIKDLNDVIRMAFAGVSSGYFFEGERRFDLVVRLDETFRNDLNTISDLYVGLPAGGQVPLRELAEIAFTEGPAQISRDNTRRRLVVSVNVRNRDVESLVEEIREMIEVGIDLPEGYSISYGGQFENLENAKKRLAIAVPVALLLIFILLHFTFNSFKQALLVYSAIPLAAIGGVFFLWVRGMPFSISAGVGFIALFGIAVLNGIILISFFNELKLKEGISDKRERIMKGTRLRLRPVVLTAATDILGFFPMAFSTSAGAEVQRPLATVVIGGLFTATLLTMIVLPVVYYIFDDMQFSFKKLKPGTTAATILLIFLFLSTQGRAQERKKLTIGEATELAVKNNAALEASRLDVERLRTLKSTSFDPGQTGFFYGVEERNPDAEQNGIESYGIEQSFEFPGMYLARARLNNGAWKTAQLKYQWEERRLKGWVSQSYYQAAYHQKKLHEYLFLDSMYTRFLHAAERRFDTGESDYLEKITARSKMMEITAQLQQARAELAKNYLELKALLQIDGDFEIMDDPGIIPAPNDSSVEYNPGLDYYRSLEEQAAARINIEKNRLAPSFRLGYTRQLVDSETGYYGYQVGVGIPLWFFPQRSQMQAARISGSIAGNLTRDFRIHYESRRLRLLEDVGRLHEILRYYMEEGLGLADDLAVTAEKNYEAGETDYLHFIQGLEQAARMRLSYLEYQHEYNQKTIELIYLL